MFSKYKADLERQREEKIAVEQSLKRESTEDELQNAKKQKLIWRPLLLLWEKAW